MPGKAFSNPQQIFKGVVMAAAGPLPDNYAVETFKNWARLRNGKFTETFTDDVTHLLCSVDQYNSQGPIVKEARRLGCNVVTYEWFLLAMCGKERRLPEHEHDARLEYTNKVQERRRRLIRARGERLAQRFINTNCYHVYIDRRLFSYKVDLVRRNPDLDQADKYTLYLYKSNAKPHLYWFAAKYSRHKGAQPLYYRETEHPTLWRRQMDAFMDFFKAKTDIDWEERLIRQGTTQAKYFQYTPPNRGKPTGRRTLFSRDFGLQLNRALRGLSPETEQGGLPSAVDGIGSEREGADELFHCEMQVCSDGSGSGDSRDKCEDSAAETPDTAFASDEEGVGGDVKSERQGTDRCE